MAEAKKAVKPSVKAKANAYWATGRRKKAIARVRLVPNGKGTITINKKDIDEIKEAYLKGLNFHYVGTIKEVIDIAILPEKIDNALEL